MKKKIILFLIIFVPIFIFTLLYSRYIGTNGLIVKEYKITEKKLLKEYHGLKIVHFSDLHYKSTINKKELKEIVNEINLLKPDLVFFTGDFITNNTKVNKKELANILSNINATIGKYSISGNHDLVNYENYEYIVTNSGFINLDDKVEYVYKNSLTPILITGLSSNLNSKTTISDRYNSLKENINEVSTYNILLLHEPDYIDKIDHSKYNLILAGHSHNGQVRLPIIGALYTPIGSKKYYDEYYKVEKSELYISSGLGTSLYKFRLFNKPSINFYRITNK